MGKPYTYNPKDTTITMNGVYLTGLGEDMISFEFDEDKFEATVGAQGDVVVNERNNDLATVTLSIYPSSPQYQMVLEYARKGTVFPFWGVNKSIGERFGGTQARVKRPPVSYGSDLEAREVEIAIFDGTNEKA